MMTVNAATKSATVKGAVVEAFTCKMVACKNAMLFAIHVGRVATHTDGGDDAVDGVRSG